MTPAENELGEEIVKAVCLHFGLDRKVLLSKRRTDQIAVPRMIGMTIALESGMGTEDAAFLFKRGDHSTAVYAKKAIYERMQVDESLRNNFVALKAKICPEASDNPGSSG